MPSTKVTLLGQILSLIDRDIIKKVVLKHSSDKFNKGIDTWTHMVSMIFMHLSAAGSLRDISNGLRSATGNLNHMGVKKAPSKSSISYINKHRNYKVFEDMYFALLESLEPSLQRSRQYAKRLKRKVFIMDSSIIPLSLSLFDWAKFRTTKGAIKLHAVLDYDTGLPSYAYITDGKKHDSKIASMTTFPSKSVLVIDRAYVDFVWLNILDSSGVYFVTRLKSNVDVEEVKVNPINEKHEHILEDEEVLLGGKGMWKKYEKSLRKVTVYDEELDQYIVLLTNNFNWTADTVSQLYKARWDIEVFFKHLKQLFRVKTFVGTCENAVRIQMWCSMVAILLVNYLKRKANYKWHLANLVTFLRINLFVKIDLMTWLNRPFEKRSKSPPENNLFSLAGVQI